jgi:hypothetical protein
MLNYGTKQKLRKKMTQAESTAFSIILSKVHAISGEKNLIQHRRALKNEVAKTNTSPEKCL